MVGEEAGCELGAAAGDHTGSQRATEDSVESVPQVQCRLGPLQKPPGGPRLRPFVFLKTKGVLESSEGLASVGRSAGGWS